MHERCSDVASKLVYKLLAMNVRVALFSLSLCLLGAISALKIILIGVKTQLTSFILAKRNLTTCTSKCFHFRFG